MGLDVSHDAFHGAYSAFNRLRQCVCEAMGDGSSFPPHYAYGDGGSIGDKFPAPRKPDLDDNLIYMGDKYTEEAYPGLWEFLMHSDCDGDIDPAMCIKVANELEALLPKVEALGWLDGGHIKRGGGFVQVIKTFCEGCRAAAAANEPLEFR